MKRVVKWECAFCGELFDRKESCLKHEQRHKDVAAANEMLENGATLQEINDKLNIWPSVPEYLKNVTKDNCFVISYWQCCSKPAYQIVSIGMRGELMVYGRGSWDGYYGKGLDIMSRDLRDPHGKEELYVDKR